MKYSIVIPTLNERENIIPLLQKIETCGLDDFEIIVVDENSPDGTCQAVIDYATTQPNIKGLLNDGSKGLSPSIVKGFNAASGEFMCCMDGDLQHDVKDLPKVLNKLETYDFVVGSRYVSGGGFAEKWSFSRVLISRTATLMAKIILDVNVKDPMSGFFAIRKSAFNKVRGDLNPQGFKIMLELLFLVTHSVEDFHITECGITFGKRIHGKSKLSFKVIFQFLKMLLKLRKSLNNLS
ncbi:MAG: polyprenol monophosphomannose synthase [Victivallaceae bacterium]